MEKELENTESRYETKEVPPSLFNLDDYDMYSKEWQGMPEFDQNKQTAYATIIFRFSSAEDLEEFSKLIGQNLNKKTLSAWYPKLIFKDSLSMRYVDSPGG